MKKTFKHLLLLFITAFFYNSLFAQVALQNPEDAILKSFDTVRSKDLTAAKTNMLAELLQASINNGIISAKGTDLNIKTTIFQLKKLWNPDVVLDRNYVKETFNRNFEFGLGFKINTNNKINGIGTSIKYAIVNRRDVTRQDLWKTKKSFKSLADRADILNKEISSYVDIFGDKITFKLQGYKQALLKQNTDAAVPKEIKLKNESKMKWIDAAIKKMGDSSMNENSLHQLGVDLGTDLLKEIGLSQSVFDLLKYPEIINPLKKAAQELEDDIKKRGLLTFGFGSNYIDNNWDSLNFKLEYLNGLGWSKDKDKPFDIYAAAFCDLKNDTIAKVSLGRQVFTAKLGLNKVLLKNRDQKTSFLEILGAAEYNYNIKGLYKGEKNNLIMADFTLSIRISPTLFLPIEIKYDIKNSNVLGFLKVKWDLPRTSGKS